MTTPYNQGYVVGLVRKDDDTVDVRWDFADAAKSGKPFFDEFKRGFDDAFDGKPRQS
jgi:hypothetical protein